MRKLFVLCCVPAAKSPNSMQQAMPRPVQQAARPSRGMAASGDAVQNRIDDITAQASHVVQLSA